MIVTVMAVITWMIHTERLRTRDHTVDIVWKHVRQLGFDPVHRLGASCGNTDRVILAPALRATLAAMRSDLCRT